MIRGPKPRLVKCYRPIDHSGEGRRWIYPVRGEVLKGFPWGWVGEGSTPFIEREVDDKVVATINAMDLAEIEFEEE